LITMAVLTGLVAGGMVFSSFSTPKQVVKEKTIANELNDPVYWEGLANNKTYYGCGLYISVYRNCGSFYAVITGTKCTSAPVGKELTVKENRNYDPESKMWYNKCGYYVTCGTSDFYFDM